jgi:hypothetical protein
MSMYVCSTVEGVFRRAGLVLTVAALIGLAGCESNPVVSLTLYPVKGRVLLPDGKPLSTGRIVFVGGKSAITSGPAAIESDGTFVVKGSSGDGLPEGDYRVRLEVDESKLPPSGGDPAKRNATLPFPPKYSDEDLSDLTATVKPDASGNSFEFKLTKQTDGAGAARKGER